MHIPDSVIERIRAGEVVTVVIADGMKLSADNKRLQNLLVSALEGGSNYWYNNADFKLTGGVRYNDLRPGGRYADPDDYSHPLEIVPFVPGCALTFKDDEGKEWEVDAAKLAAGLELMKYKYPHHFADVICENDDATTGDVLLQLATFGQIVYG